MTIIRTPLLEGEIFGFVLPNGEFRICGEMDQEVDFRKLKKGKICSSFTRSDLIDLMLRMGMQNPGNFASKNDICVSIRDHMESTGRLL